MRRAALFLPLLFSMALAGGRGGIPPSLPSLVASTAPAGRAFDRDYAGRMQMFQNALLEAASTTLNRSRDAAVRQAAQSVITTQRRDQQRLQAFQRAWGVSVGAYGIADIVGPDNGRDEGNVDRWFLNVALGINRDLIQLSEQALKRAGRADVKTFARDLVHRRTAENARYAAMLKELP